VSHLDEKRAGHQRSELVIEFYAVVDLSALGGGEITVPLEALTHEESVETGLFDEGLHDQHEGSADDDADDGGDPDGDDEGTDKRRESDDGHDGDDGADDGIDDDDGDEDEGSSDDGDDGDDDGVLPV
jgi:hypothetical protein